MPFQELADFKKEAAAMRNTVTRPRMQIHRAYGRFKMNPRNQQNKWLNENFELFFSQNKKTGDNRPSKGGFEEQSSSENIFCSEINRDRSWQNLIQSPENEINLEASDNGEIIDFEKETEDTNDRVINTTREAEDMPLETHIYCEDEYIKLTKMVGVNCAQVMNKIEDDSSNLIDLRLNCWIDKSVNLHKKITSSGPQAKPKRTFSNSSNDTDKTEVKSNKINDSRGLYSSKSVDSNISRDKSTVNLIDEDMRWFDVNRRLNQYDFDSAVESFSSKKLEIDNQEESYDTCYFVNQSNNLNDQFTKVCETESPNQTDFLNVAERNSEASYFSNKEINKEMERCDSSHSNVAAKGSTSRSNSSSFESALSSSDLKSPFGSFRGNDSDCSFRNHQHLDYPLTGQDIPTMLNNIIIHKALEKIHRKRIDLHNENIFNDLNKEKRNNDYCCEESIINTVKLKRNEQMKKGNHLLEDKIKATQSKLCEGCNLGRQRLSSLNKQTEIGTTKRFDLSRRRDTSNEGTFRRSFVNSGSKNSYHFKFNDTVKIAGNDNIVEKTNLNSNKLKSKIPRPVISRNTSVKKKSNPEINSLIGDSIKYVTNEINWSDSKNILPNNIHNDSLSQSRRSVGSNKNAKTSSIHSCHTSKKSLSKEEKIEEIRSKYWKRNDKVNPTRLTDKTLSFKSTCQKESRSNEKKSTNAPRYGTTYGKIARVTTAPINQTNRKKYLQTSVSERNSRPETADVKICEENDIVFEDGSQEMYGI